MDAHICSNKRKGLFFVVVFFFKFSTLAIFSVKQLKLEDFSLKIGGFSFTCKNMINNMILSITGIHVIYSPGPRVQNEREPTYNIGRRQNSSQENSGRGLDKLTL